MARIPPFFAVRHNAAVRSVILLVLLCLPIAPAMTLNIYDVVELSRGDYSDSEIVGIIEATESVFELTSEDVTGLKNLGISPQVIKIMMQRSNVTKELAAGPIIDPFESASEVSDQAATHEAEPADEKYPVNPFSISSTPRSTAIPAPFSINHVREDASGEHQHFTVDLYGVRLLVLRDEGRYATLEDRARAIALRLDEARRAGQGKFRAIHVNGEEVVVFQDDTGALDISILTVSGSDVIAYDVRSEQRVTADLLAMYWSALFNDYWNIAFQRQPPEQLRHLHRGEALMLLYAVVRNTPDDEEFSLERGVQQLPKSIQKHLGRLAYAVPEDFEESDE